MAVKPNQSAESVAIRTARRILMQSLNSSFPAKTYVKTLWGNAIYIEPTYDKEMFVKDIFYLQKKGYLELTENVLTQGSKLFDKFILLTAEGKEIAEQTMSDPALEL
jgi:hypothetical protein